MTSDHEAAIATLARWKTNPVAFVFENFQVEPDTWQREALDSFADPAKPRISLQACVGPGKSAVLTWCGWYFLACYGELFEHPKGAAVAITQDNLKDNLWSEFAKWRARSSFLTAAFEWTQSRVFAKAHPETWFIASRSWSKTSTPEEQGKTLSGLHSKFVLALIDESGAIPTTVLRAADQALSNCAFGKIVQAGNPASREGMLHAAATTLRHQWHVIRITGDPEDPRRSPRIDASWAREQIAQYGRDNPWIKASILGEFPPTSLNALLGVEEVEAAMHRHVREDQYHWAQKRIGIDCARFDDPWVLAPRQGLVAFLPTVLRAPRTQEVVARVIRSKVHWSSEREYIDDTGGFGAGLIDGLLAAGYAPTPVNFSGKASHPRFYNRRAEMWFGLAEWVKRGGALPRVPELVAELTVPTYSFRDGKFIIEDKDQIKVRLGRSPNHADALALTFAEVDMPAALAGVGGRRQPGHALTDFDPYRQTETPR